MIRVPIAEAKQTNLALGRCLVITNCTWQTACISKEELGEKLEIEWHLHIGEASEVNEAAM